MRRRDEFDDEVGCQRDEQLDFSGQWHFNNLIENAMRLHAINQSGPLGRAVDAQGNVVDTRNILSFDRGKRRIDEMNQWTLIVVEPIAFNAEWRSMTLTKACNVAKKMSQARKILTNNRGVVELHKCPVYLCMP